MSKQIIASSGNLNTEVVDKSNANFTELYTLVESTGSLLFDKPFGRRYGTWDAPVTGDLVIDETGAQDGYCVVVVWSGSATPNVTGGELGCVNGSVDEQSTYNIYFNRIDGKYNVNILKDSSVPDTIVIFEDDFAGTTIDTAKWNVLNPDVANVPITQNNELIVSYDGTTASSNFVNNLIGKTGYDISTTKIISFDIKHTNQSEQRWGIGLTKDFADLTANDNGIKMSYSSTAGALVITLKEANVVTYQFSPTESITTYKTFKIIVSGGNVSWWVWDGSWTQLGITTSHTSSGDWYPFIDCANLINPAGIYNVDNLVITNEDFTTQRP